MWERCEITRVLGGFGKFCVPLEKSWLRPAKSLEQAMMHGNRNRSGSDNDDGNGNGDSNGKGNGNGSSDGNGIR